MLLSYRMFAFKDLNIATVSKYKNRLGQIYCRLILIYFIYIHIYSFDSKSTVNMLEYFIC